MAFKNIYLLCEIVTHLEYDNNLPYQNWQKN